MSEYRDEAECYREMFATQDARDASDDRTDLGTRLSERCDELAAELEGVKQIAQDRLRDLVARETMIDVLMRRIELMLEAPHPVCEFATAGEGGDHYMVMSDGAVYDFRWTDTGLRWVETTPLPLTRRAIALEIAKQQESSEPFMSEEERDRRARAGATERDSCVPTETLEDVAELRRSEREARAQRAGYDT